MKAIAPGDGFPSAFEHAGNRSLDYGQDIARQALRKDLGDVNMPRRDGLEMVEVLRRPRRYR
jgi:CheY-like chemotaxis protein